MPVIKHKDIEIHYDFHELIPHLKVFHQDLYTISYDSDMGIEVNPEGKAKADLLQLGYDHPNNSFSQNRFNEMPPLKIPSYNYLNCITRKKKFNYPDIINNSGIIGPNQLLISYKLMGIFQKFRMAPHITVPAVIKFRDTYIDDNYLVLYFYHHGCDHVVWDKTVFAYTKGLTKWEIIETFNFNSISEYKEFINDPYKNKYKIISISFKHNFDIFYSLIGANIYATQKVRETIDQSKIMGLWFSHDAFETKITQQK